MLLRLFTATGRFLLLSMLILVAGCSGESKTIINADGDSRKVSDVVESFNEARSNTKRAEPLFVKGAVPKGPDFKKYSGFSFATTGTASINGDSATMEVMIQDESTSKEAGKQEWTFKKEGDSWKIEKAPLP